MQKKLITLSSRDFLQEILQIFNVFENIFVSNMFWTNIAVIKAHFLHEYFNLAELMNHKISFH